MSVDILPIDQRAAKIKKAVVEFTKEGKRELNPLDAKVVGDLKLEGETSASHSSLKSAILYDMEANVRRLNAIRTGNDSQIGVTDMNFADVVQSMYGFSSVNDFLRIGLGIEPSRITSEQLWGKPEFNMGYRWLVPELLLAAMKLGLRKAPIHDSLIADTISISQPEAKMPIINFSDAMPTIIGEADTIPTGSVSFGQKSVNTFKIGTGVKLTDEVIKYVTLDMLSLYMQDMPVQLNNALDALALYIITNGNQAGESAPVIGVKTANKWEYRDLLRPWARGSRMNRDFTTILADEETGLDIYTLPEFGYLAGVEKKGEIDLKSNIPMRSDLFIHGAIGANSLLMVDKSKALIKLMVEAMSLETERIIQNGINATYLKTRCGFAKMWQDGAVIVSNTIPYNTVTGQVGGFPTYMDPKPIETAVLKGRSAV